MNEYVSLSHGSGGRQSRDLIKKVFTERFGIAEPLTDSAIIDESFPPGSRVVITTDAYVVDPLFFPGGDIGKLAVTGTINDIAVSGARIAAIAASFIIEEGFPVNDLVKIAESMALEAERAGTRLVSGDTKVVGKGKCDKLFITTTGTGFVLPQHKHISSGLKVTEGDRIIINGSVGNHAIAVLGARNDLSFKTEVLSDCRALNRLTEKILDNCREIHFMRDLTRGGLAAVLNELKAMVKCLISINEDSVPVDEPVRGLCEVLGFDPFSLANEGKLIVVAGKNEFRKVLEIMQSDPSGCDSSVIGEIVAGDRPAVILNTTAGGRRIVELPSGSQLPRIC
ncbi:MAG TPA: hydrogenase expression/formation protein HypE [Bacteroidales bacterium]|nr:hydrogenase expression/formation protein HypE [Bacteroidales bacterium]